MTNKKLKLPVLFIFLIFSITSFCQFRAKEINWTPDGTAYLKLKDGNIIKTDVKTNTESVIVKKEQLIPTCLLYTSPSPRDRQKSRMPSSA